MPIRVTRNNCAKTMLKPLMLPEHHFQNILVQSRRKSYVKYLMIMISTFFQHKNRKRKSTWKKERGSFDETDELQEIKNRWKWEAKRLIALQCDPAMWLNIGRQDEILQRCDYLIIIIRFWMYFRLAAIFHRHDLDILAQEHF